MKQVLNEIPLKTTNSFKVNNLEIDLDSNIKSTFLGYQTNSDILYDVNDLAKLSSIIGLTVNGGTKIDLKINDNNKDPIIFNYNFDNDDNLVEEINIEVAPSVNANLIFNYQAKNNLDHVHYLKYNIIVNDCASLNVSVLNLLNDYATSLIALESKVLDHANLTYNLFDIGGKTKISNCYGDTYNNGTNNLNVVYFGKENDLIDSNYHYLNNGINSNNKIEVQGILTDCASKTFRGTIKFVKGSSGSSGFENENCLMLTDHVHSISAPLLLCDEEDVSGGHSASSGEIDKDKIFYLMAKGLTQKEATNLIIMANINPILNQINNDELIDLITKQIISVL